MSWINIEEFSTVPHGTRDRLLLKTP
jgi:hypothetical protein